MGVDVGSRRFAERAGRAGLGVVIAIFLALAMPLAFERPTGGRSAERQGYTAGIIRVYCLDPGHSILKGPQIHFGRNPFNLELTVFEWVQGVVARGVGGAGCDAVEPVGKSFSVLLSAVAILGAWLLAAHLWGPWAGLMAAVLLGVDELWLRYATYTMIENRVLACALFAILFSLRRRSFPAGAFWALTFTQKPQIFVFASVFWITLEATRAGGLRAVARAILVEVESRATAIAYSAACVAGLAWAAWSHRIAEGSDLPWIIHTGPRAWRWYFGDWAERATLHYWKSLGLGLFRDTGLNIALPFALLFRPAGPGGRLGFIRQALVRAAPLAAAFTVYSFFFHNVFVVHEYYALPLNVGRALSAGAMLALLCEAYGVGAERASASVTKRKLGVLAALVAVGVLGRFAVVGIGDFMRYRARIHDPGAEFFHREWDRNVFPEKNRFVVMASPGTGRDLLHLYLAKQRGFVWCAANKEFAPRAYWRQAGVEYIAWADALNPATGVHDWTVRSMDEEIEIARRNGWSSDLHDVWAGRTMAEWARLASRTGKDPCLRRNEFDPRSW